MNICLFNDEVKNSDVMSKVHLEIKEKILKVWSFVFVDRLYFLLKEKKTKTLDAFALFFF
jgi:hypothetical protein